MPREVTAELLDRLPPSDPAALHSRRDLARLNAVMGNHRFLARALRTTLPRRSRPRLLDLATGDGTLVLKVVQALGPVAVGSELFLVDRCDVVGGDTRQALRALGWTVVEQTSDAVAWFQRPARPGFDAVVTNLFLHHLTDRVLARLLAQIARRTHVFVAVEPRRGAWPLFQSRLVGLLGCNRVTRKDAVASVRSGFAGRELSDLWPPDPRWQLSERAAGLASHLFVASLRGG